ncbi:MAG: HAMP domain-containing protein [Acidobacteria bacterium]|nr:HAMP domain-containing protein [Acidobacteriota bacterium]
MSAPEVKLGRLEIATIAVFVLWRALERYMAGSMLAPVSGFVFFALLLATAVRWVRRLVQNAIWSLRNRLLLSYVFIAVVPVFLLGVLGVLGAWILSGQVGAYLVTQAFNQDLEILRGAAQGTMIALERAGSPQAIRFVELANGRFPGIQSAIDDVTNGNGFQLDHPRQEMKGIFLKEGLLFAGVHIRRGEHKVTLLAPITKDYLQDLVPNLGEITLVDWSKNPGASRRKMNLHSFRPRRDDTPVIAQAVNALDYEVLWGMPHAVHDWADPTAEHEALLGVRTRISQVGRVIYSQKADWDSAWQIYLLYAVGIAFLFVEFVALCIGIAVTRTMTRAVHYLHESTERVQAGDFTYRIPVKGHDQLAELGNSYNEMIGNLDRLLKVAKEKERLQADLDIAKEVQEQLYPRSVPRVEGLRITAKLNPAKSVSGDYYDYQKVDDHHVTIAIGDVSGKGISAAILMANVQSAMRAQLRVAQQTKCDVDPAAMVSQINKHLEANTTVEKYSTFFFSVYDERTGALKTTNAGHLPPILIRGGEVIRLDVNGMVIGMFAHAQYDESTVVLHKGDLLLLYTDGITEAENEYGEMWGEERMIDAVRRSAHKSNEEILDEVFAEVEQWTYSPDSADDMTMMIVRRI